MCSALHCTVSNCTVVSSLLAGHVVHRTVQCQIVQQYDVIIGALPEALQGQDQTRQSRLATRCCRVATRMHNTPINQTSQLPYHCMFDIATLILNSPLNDYWMWWSRQRQNRMCPNISHHYHLLENQLNTKESCSLWVAEISTTNQIQVHNEQNIVPILRINTRTHQTCNMVCTHANRCFLLFPPHETHVDKQTLFHAVSDDSDWEYDKTVVMATVHI